MGILQLYWDTMGMAQLKTSCDFESFYTVKQYRRGGHCWGAVAYLITRKGMQDVLQHSGFLNGTSLHLKKTEQVQYGQADGYIYECTVSGNSGFPFLIPDNRHLKTTQYDRSNMKAHDINALGVSYSILKQHAQSFPPKQFTYLKRPPGTSYRLSDAYHGWFEPQITKKYHKKWYPNSIVGQYFQVTSRFEQFDVLVKVVQQNKDILTQTPPNDAVVIHLRVGDVIEQCGYSVDAHLEKELPYTKIPTNPKIWVHSKGYYDQQLAQFPKIKNIELVYGKHQVKSMATSEEYVTKLTQHFKSRGYNVKIHESDFDPDQDFLYLCCARHLIAGGASGFSNLALKVNQHLKSNKLI